MVDIPTCELGKAAVGRSPTSLTLIHISTTKGSYYYSFNVDPYFRDLFEDGDYRKDMLFWATDPGADVESAAYVWMLSSTSTTVLPATKIPVS